MESTQSGLADARGSKPAEVAAAAAHADGHGDGHAAAEDTSKPMARKADDNARGGDSPRKKARLEATAVESGDASLAKRYEAVRRSYRNAFEATTMKKLRLEATLADIMVEESELDQDDEKAKARRATLGSIHASLLALIEERNEDLLHLDFSRDGLDRLTDSERVRRDDDYVAYPVVNVRGHLRDLLAEAAAGKQLLDQRLHEIEAEVTATPARQRDLEAESIRTVLCAGYFGGLAVTLRAQLKAMAAVWGQRD